MWNFNGRRRPSFAIEPSENEESVWDYPRPPICVKDEREVVVQFAGVQIAKTRQAIRVLETASPPTFYLPTSDIEMPLLIQSPGASYCEWKGNATYWSLTAGDDSISNVGWSYESPNPKFESIQGYLSFYPAKVQCLVDGESVRPQPGGFYGGWVTDEIVGPYKGEPGTGGW